MEGKQAVQREFIVPKSIFQRAYLLAGGLLLWDVLLFTVIPLKSSWKFYLGGLSFILTLFALEYIIDLRALERVILRDPNLTRRLTEFTVASLPLQKEKGNILVIGAARGDLALALGRKYPKAEVEALDLWEGMYRDWKYLSIKKVEQEGLSNVSFFQGDIRQWTMEKGSLAALVSNFGFRSLPRGKEREEFLEKFLEWVEPGGAFALVDFFYHPKYYDDVKDLPKELEAKGFRRVRLYPLVDGTLLTKEEARKGKLLGSGILVGVK